MSDANASGDQRHQPLTHAGEIPPPENRVEILSDGEGFLIFGDTPEQVRAFLEEYGWLGDAAAPGQAQLAAVLRASGGLMEGLSDKLAESASWVKLTRESSEAVERLGLMPTEVPGISHAMLGSPGDIKKWLQIDNRVRARLTNPTLLSGVGGVLFRLANELEAAAEREVLQVLDRKLDDVLRGQRDEILGDLVGIEREIRQGTRMLEKQGRVDGDTWAKVAGASLELRRVQSKALLELEALAMKVEERAGGAKFDEKLKPLEAEVRTWIAVATRCSVSLSELAMLEVAHQLELDPAGANDKRIALDASLQEDQDRVRKALSYLISRIEQAATRVSSRTLLHPGAVLRAIGAINAAGDVVARYFEAHGRSIEWKPVVARPWRSAITSSEQWSSAGAELTSLARENAAPLGLGALLTLASVRVLASKDDDEDSEDDLEA